MTREKPRNCGHECPMKHDIQESDDEVLYCASYESRVRRGTISTPSGPNSGIILGRLSLYESVLPALPFPQVCDALSCRFNKGIPHSTQPIK